VISCEPFTGGSPDDRGDEAAVMIETSTRRLDAAIGRLRAQHRSRRLPLAIVRVREAVERAREAPGRIGTTHPRLVQAIESVATVVRRARARVRIPAAAKAIRHAIERQGEKEMDAWTRLVAGWGDRGLPVASLSVCGHGTAEVRFTRLLAHHLDPNAPHGLGTRLLAALFGDAVARRDVVVTAEADLGTVRLPNGESKSSSLDILILVEATHTAILVEQKIRAAEGVDVAGDQEVRQLSRYSQAFADRYRDYAGRETKFFLTPTGKTPSDDDTWTPMSHGECVARLVPVLSDRTLTLIARTNLTALLWELLVGPLELSGRLSNLRSIARDIVTTPSRFPELRRSASIVFPPIDTLLLLLRELP